MSNPFSRLPPAPPGVLAGGMVVASCWPVATGAGCVTVGLAGLVRQAATPDAGQPWMPGAPWLAAVVLPLWPGRQPLRQSNTMAGQALRLQHAVQTGSHHRFHHRACWPDGTARKGHAVVGQPAGVLRPRVASPGPDAAQPRGVVHGQADVVLAELDQAGNGRRWRQRTRCPCSDPRGGAHRGLALVRWDGTARKHAARALAVGGDKLRQTLNTTGDTTLSANAAGPHTPLATHQQAQLGKILQGNSTRWH